MRDLFIPNTETYHAPGSPEIRDFVNAADELGFIIGKAVFGDDPSLDTGWQVHQMPGDSFMQIRRALESDDAGHAFGGLWYQSLGWLEKTDQGVPPSVALYQRPRFVTTYALQIAFSAKQMKQVRLVEEADLMITARSGDHAVKARMANSGGWQFSRIIDGAHRLPRSGDPSDYLYRPGDDDLTALRQVGESFSAALDTHGIVIPEPVS